MQQKIVLALVVELVLVEVVKQNLYGFSSCFSVELVLLVVLVIDQVADIGIELSVCTNQSAWLSFLALAWNCIRPLL